MKHEIEGDPIANAFAAMKALRQKAEDRVMAAASTWAQDKTEAHLQAVEAAVQEMLESGRQLDLIRRTVLPKEKKP